MTTVLQRKILDLAIRAGELMMKNGAEVYRVEDTILRICKACKVDNADVFATLTGVFVSISYDGEGETVATAIRRVHNTSIDLGKISRINAFAREFTNTDLSIDEGMKILNDIDKENPYPFPLRLISSGIICSFFSLIFGGNTLDACWAFALGIGAYLLNLLLSKLDTNYFLKGFICTSFATLGCVFLSGVGLIDDYGPVVIGILMIFVPGFSITTSMRDFLTGDMLAGLARLTEALAIAVSLAAGAGIALQIWSLTGGIIL